MWNYWGEFVMGVATGLTVAPILVLGPAGIADYWRTRAFS